MSDLAAGSPILNWPVVSTDSEHSPDQCSPAQATVTMDDNLTDRVEATVPATSYICGSSRA